ncbi:GTPase IMAP family member 4-like isoform X2 [Ahaetulla prasina]|uniref:GTPase IMAP family member 4-like isoform X2 n=1 Tax=Ahaetulla prasina TaxID=499056 RepID=UPI0026480566|nr:GTPase IMAP family member 4-like isoform X2 [Ahaetulla prasina]
MLQSTRSVNYTRKPSMALAEDTIEIPALDRPFQLGMLYDCRKDMLIPGFTLWDDSSLQKDLNVNLQPKTESEIIASDSLDDKASALDISVSLKKSRVLCCATCLEMPGSIGGPERRIVLVGESGSGISATGNTILGSKVFHSGWSPKVVLRVCQKEETQLNGRKVVVVDMPDFSDRPDKDIAAREVRKSTKLCSPGPHVILHVMHPFLFSPEERYVAQHIKELFGLEAKDYMILWFTCKDLKGQSLENKYLKEYIAECRNRFLAFNNWAEGAEREAQVAELIYLFIIYYLNLYTALSPKGLRAVYRHIKTSIYKLK